jgi:hypothetical protein
MSGSLAICVGAVLLNSCSFSSVSTDKTERSDRRTFGELYYLPYGRIHITGSLATPAKATTESNTPSPTNTPPPATQPKTTADDTTGSQDESAKSKEYTITVTEELQPDKDAAYYLDQRRNWAFDDENHFIVNKKFLLTSSKVTVQDRTPDIIATTASLVAQAAGINPISPASIPKVSAEEAKDKLNFLKISKTELRDKVKDDFNSKYNYAEPDYISNLKNEFQQDLSKAGVSQTEIPLVLAPVQLRVNDLIKALQDDRYKDSQILTATVKAVLDANNIKPGERAFNESIFRLEQQATATKEQVEAALLSVKDEPMDEQSQKVLLSSFYKQDKKNAPVAPKPFTVVFDPESKDEKSQAVEIMKQCGFDLRADAENPTTADAGDKHDDSPKAKVRTRPFFEGDRINGVVYRAPKTYKIYIRSLAGSLEKNPARPVKKGAAGSFKKADEELTPSTWDDAHILINQSVALPDKQRSLVADYARFAFIRRSTNIGFLDGMLVDYDQITPSPVLGFLAIPKGILQALLPIPSGSSSTKPPGGATSGSGTL